MLAKHDIYKVCFVILSLTTIISFGVSNASPDTATKLTSIEMQTVSKFNNTISLEKAFPSLPDMDFPDRGLFLTALIQSPNDNTTWYAILQHGVVRQFVNSVTTSTSSVFIDITDRVSAGGEMGLLGMAFHPDYPKSPYVYLSYTTTTPMRRSVISQFVNVGGVWQETEILSVQQPYSNHNGGQITFGPDNYLYIGLGDGGSGYDPDGHGQNTSSLLGSMLRIQVGGSSLYDIPKDNPFFGNTKCNKVTSLVNAKSCPEIYAWGLRNPWRWSFDKQTQELWLGDVGQDSYEEIDIINKGQNYGWQVMEAWACTEGGVICNKPQKFTEPVMAYAHQAGYQSVIGGYVYRGNDDNLKNLVGTYFYTDAYVGKIYGLQFDRGSGKYVSRFMGAKLNNQNIFSFAQSNKGELFVLATGMGGKGNNIYRLRTGSGLPFTTADD